MKYKELIQFEPVVDIIQLRQADRIEQLALFIADENSAHLWIRLEFELNLGHG